VSGLSGKTIFVTGAASGLGQATAMLAARQGSNLVLSDLNAAGLDSTAGEVRGAGHAVRTLVVDVQRPEDCAELAALAVREFGRLDGAVCAAGIQRTAPAVEMALEDWQSLLAVNLTGSFLSAQAAGRAMLAGGNGGSIVTFASGLAIRGQAGAAHYAASKAGIIAMTKSLALEWAGRGIRANAVAPGLVDTPMVRAIASTEEIEAWGRAAPMGRAGRPEDVASVVCFLLSDASGFVTGQTVHINGGYLMP
jgi:NAD(P)-dependent dehydrogenase (short-subunit alcohol dehydrogenase family)